MKRQGSMFFIILLVLSIGVILANIFSPMPVRQVIVIKEVEVQTFFNFGKFQFDKLEFINDFMIFHKYENLDMQYFQNTGLIPSFSITTTAPIVIISAAVDSKYKYNLDYCVTLSTKRITVDLSFYEWGNKGTITTAQLNVNTGEIKEVVEEIICIPPDLKG
jgi:hypothetical protein